MSSGSPDVDLSEREVQPDIKISDRRNGTMANFFMSVIFLLLILAFYRVINKGIKIIFKYIWIYWQDLLKSPESVVSFVQKAYNKVNMKC